MAVTKDAVFVRRPLFVWLKGKEEALHQEVRGRKGETRRTDKVEAQGAG